MSRKIRCQTGIVQKHEENFHYRKPQATAQERGSEDKPVGNALVECFNKQIAVTSPLRPVYAAVARCIIRCSIQGRQASKKRWGQTDIEGKKDKTREAHNGNKAKKPN